MTKRRIVIGISDAGVSDNPSDVLATYSLGSCIGVCLFDPVMTIGGMLHFQLPNSTMDAKRAGKEPLMFADTGMNYLIREMTSKGAKRNRMQVKIAGGAAMDIGPKGFDIGKRNYLALKKILWQNGMFLNAEDIGGNQARNLFMNVADGAVTIRSNGLAKNI